MERRAFFGRRLHRILGVAGATLLLAGAGLFSLHAYATATIRDRAASALHSRLGRDVTIGEVDVGLSAIAVHDIEIVGVARVDRVVASYEFSSLFGDDVQVGRIDVYGVALDVDRDSSGSLSVADIVSHMRARASGGEDGESRKSGIDLSGVPIELHDVTLSVVDEVTASQITVSAAHVTPNRDEGELEIIGGAFSGSSEQANLARLLAGKDVANTDGSISFADGLAKMDLSGSFSSAPSERWTLTGSFDVENRSASLHVETDSVVLARLVTSESSRQMILDPEESTVNAALDVALSKNEITVSGSASVAGLSFTHHRVAAEPVRDVALTASGTLAIDRAAKSLRISDGRIKSRNVEYDLGFAAQLADPNRTEHPAATLSATLSVASVPCQDLLDSIPAGLAPDLQGFELKGAIQASVELAIDWAALKKTRFSSTVLAPGAGINNCRVVAAPERVSADRLRGSFEHTVPVGDEWMTFTVGPESDEYVPLSKVSRHLTRSLMTTEDSRFYRHDGFITKEFRMALIKNLEKGRFAYGASSISMQVVKNVLLARKKTVSRKLEELFLTWYIERELSKDRILEIYVNAIEFGPGIYGIKRAAKRYFNKHPRRLNPVESAFFSSILPAPVRRFKQYCRGWAGRWTQGKIDRILDIMLERNRLDEEQYWNAIGTPLIFRGSRRDICRQYEEGLIGKPLVTSDPKNDAKNDAKKGKNL